MCIFQLISCKDLCAHISLASECIEQYNTNIVYMILLTRHFYVYFLPHSLLLLKLPPGMPTLSFYINAFPPSKIIPWNTITSRDAYPFFLYQCAFAFKDYPLECNYLREYLVQPKCILEVCGLLFLCSLILLHQ